MKNEKAASVLSILMIIIILSFYSFIPKVDWKNYYNFADKRYFFYTPCALDVWSNIFYIIAGLVGIFKNLKKDFYLAFLSISIILTGIGSSFFHLNPSLETIIWDRIPMIFVFASIIGILLRDKYNYKLGKFSFYFILIWGLLSQVLWKYKYIDLRPYFIIQYFGILLICIQIFFNPNGKIKTTHLIFLLLSYLLAKVFEIYDVEIFNSNYLISGHTLKHILSGFGVILFINGLTNELTDKKTPA